MVHEFVIQIPDELAELATDPRAMALSKRLAVVWWGNTAETVVVIFDGKQMALIKSLAWRADSEEGVSPKIVLVQTSKYKQPQDFIDELLNCGFTVTIEAEGRLRPYVLESGGDP